MTEIADRYRTLAAAFTACVAAVPAARWEDPSPCENWTARDVVGHVAKTEEQFLGLVGQSAPPRPSAEDDPLGAWAAVRDAVQAALDDPALATLEYDGFFGRTTLEQTVNNFGCFDLVVHRWDLARATGQDERLDPDEVHQVFETAKGLGDTLRGPNVCGRALEPAAGADEQTQLLNYLGRAV